MPFQRGGFVKAHPLLLLNSAHLKEKWLNCRLIFTLILTAFFVTSTKVYALHLEEVIPGKAVILTQHSNRFFQGVVVRASGGLLGGLISNRRATIQTQQGELIEIKSNDDGVFYQLWHAEGCAAESICFGSEAPQHVTYFFDYYADSGFMVQLLGYQTRTQDGRKLFLGWDNTSSSLLRGYPAAETTPGTCFFEMCIDQQVFLAPENLRQNEVIPWKVVAFSGEFGCSANPSVRGRNVIIRNEQDKLSLASTCNGRLIPNLQQSAEQLLATPLNLKTGEEIIVPLNAGYSSVVDRAIVVGATTVGVIYQLKKNANKNYFLTYRWIGLLSGCLGGNLCTDDSIVLRRTSDRIAERRVLAVFPLSQPEGLIAVDSTIPHLLRAEDYQKNSEHSSSTARR